MHNLCSWLESFFFQEICKIFRKNFIHILLHSDKIVSYFVFPKYIMSCSGTKQTIPKHTINMKRYSQKRCARFCTTHIECKERSTHPTIGLMKPSAFFFCSISSAGDGWGRVAYLMNCPNHQTNGSPWRRLSRGAWWQTAQHSTEIGCVHIVDF